MGILTRAAWLGLVVVAALTVGLRAGQAETRFALVIGNSDYRTGPLATPVNDAGLVADALTAAGFAVTGAANLDQATLRETFREFIDQVAAAGPDSVALVYLSGYGLQFNGDNYFVPVDADIARDVDVPLQAVRIADFAEPLAALPARVKIVILDAARENPFARGGEPLAGGLALANPVAGTAFAFNAAPGTVGPSEPGPYGAYATAFAEMIAAGGLSLDDLFARVRLRVSDLTNGAEVPWYASALSGPFFMTELVAGAPPPPNVLPLADIRDKPLRDYADNVDDAYAAVLELDTIEGYEQFLALYPNSPYSQRVAAMLAVRREEIIWLRCIADDTPQAYWSYLRRYPHGPHAWDARRRLAILRAALEPPPSFAIVDFGVPPPPPAELVFIDRPVPIFEVPGWAPPPRPPLRFLPPRPREFAVLRPLPRPRERFALPVPGARVIPVFVKPPASVTVRPRAGGAAGRTTVPISLPKAVEHPGAPGVQHQPTGGAPIVSPTHRGPPPPPPSAALKPAPPPPHPPAAHPTMVRPAPPPPRPAPPHPVMAKPAPPPPRPAPPHPAVAKPAPPPPKPPAKPACPPGKHPTPQGCK
jgi:uncharacterized caspase-like protein